MLVSIHMLCLSKVIIQTNQLNSKVKCEVDIEVGNKHHSSQSLRLASYAGTFIILLSSMRQMLLIEHCKPTENHISSQFIIILLPSSTSNRK